MANIKATQDAINAAQSFFKSITIVSADALEYANEINNIVLEAQQWEFMAKTGAPFGTTALVQDYSSVPADFLWFKYAWVQDDSNSANPKFSLRVLDEIEPATQPRGRPLAISLSSAAGAYVFRLFPVPQVTRAGTGQWAVGFDYYSRPVAITTLAQTFEFPDHYFDVFKSGFIAKVADVLDDTRAGVWNGRDATGKFSGTGLWLKFAVMLNQMIESEDTSSGAPSRMPVESIWLG